MSSQHSRNGTVIFSLELNTQNDAGETPLFIATRKVNITALTLLLGKQNIAIDKVDNDGNSPLMVAIKNKYPTIVKKLFNSTASPHLKNYNEETLTTQGNELIHLVLENLGNLCPLDLTHLWALELSLPATYFTSSTGKKPQQDLLKNWIFHRTAYILHWCS